MIIDNSMANTFRECPYKFLEAYMRIHPKTGQAKGIEPIPGDGIGKFDFGTRWHEVMEEHYKGKSLYPPDPRKALEDEIQWCLGAYKKQYPAEPFDIVDVERTFLIDLPNSHHQYAGKIDIVARLHESGKLNIFDHKSEKRGSKENEPQKWAARDQGTLYLYAGSIVYGEPVEAFWVNVLTKPSPAGQIGPSFPPRQKLERSQIQIDTAVRDLIVIADTIEDYLKKFGQDAWPANRENCVKFGQCEFYLPHTWGWDDNVMNVKYQPKTDYLHLDSKLKILP